MGSSRVQHLSQSVQLPKQGLCLAFASLDTTAWVDLQAEIDGASAIAGRPGKPWCGGFVAIQAEGSDLFVALTTGAASPDNDLDAAGVSTASDDPEANVGMMIPAGQTVHAWIEEGTYRYLAFVNRSGESGFVRLWPSSRKELFNLGS